MVNGRQHLHVPSQAELYPSLDVHRRLPLVCIVISISRRFEPSFSPILPISNS